MTKKQAAQRLREIAIVMESSAWDDEGVIMWVDAIREVATLLDKQGAE